MWLADINIQNKYEIAVNEALTDYHKFKTFKNNPNYNCIVGMSQQWQAPFFYDFIKEKNKNIFNKINSFIKNDLIGSPEIWNSIDGVSISPNTLRYIKTLVDLENAFGNLDNFVIAELGVGYGGLSLIINTNSKLKDYVLCDLPQVQKLAQKYLSIFNIHATDDKNKYDEFDLFISEFCLSEFSDEQIDIFYEELILKSNRIYLTMNLHDEIRKEKFLNKIKKHFKINIFDEYPITRWPNYIITGNKK
jgi:putative sugar O-methyltransferase